MAIRALAMRSPRAAGLAGDGRAAGAAASEPTTTSRSRTSVVCPHAASGDGEDEQRARAPHRACLQRPGLARDAGQQTGPGAGRAVECEAALEHRRGAPRARAGRCRRRVRPADAVVGDLDLHLAVAQPQPHGGVRRVGVAHDVREPLGHHEVGGGLDRGRQPHVDAARRTRRRQRRARDQRLDRRAEPALGQDRGMDAAGQLAQLGQRVAELARDARRPPRRPPGRRAAAARSIRRSSASATSCCCAPSCRSRSIRRRASSAASTMRSARRAQLLHAGAQVGLQALVVDRQRGGGGGGAARARASRRARRRGRSRRRGARRARRRSTSRPEPASGSSTGRPVSSTKIRRSGSQ